MRYGFHSNLKSSTFSVETRDSTVVSTEGKILPGTENCVLRSKYYVPMPRRFVLAQQLIGFEGRTAVFSLPL